MKQERGRGEYDQTISCAYMKFSENKFLEFKIVSHYYVWLA